MANRQNSGGSPVNPNGGGHSEAAAIGISNNEWKRNAERRYMRSGISGAYTEQAGNGYSNPLAVTPSASTVIYLRVEGYALSSEGTYRIRYYTR
ncbi:MAG: hypothetical protein LBD37_02625 [Treponema sp.]|nr:hypothetical protein [Treponema sp.]